LSGFAVGRGQRPHQLLFAEIRRHVNGEYESVSSGLEECGLTTILQPRGEEVIGSYGNRWPLFPVFVVITEVKIERTIRHRFPAFIRHFDMLTSVVVILPMGITRYQQGQT